MMDIFILFPPIGYAVAYSCRMGFVSLRDGGGTQKNSLCVLSADYFWNKEVIKKKQTK